jgi:hypothetical protein
VTPPSITIAWPVINALALLASYTTAPAISSGSPIRRKGAVELVTLTLSGCFHNALTKSVLISPGAVQLTRHV